MKKTGIAAVILAVVLTLQFAFSYKEKTATEKCRELFIEKSATYYDEVKKLETEIHRADSLGYADVSTAQAAYRSARREYKRLEILIEYYAPATAKLLNGPLVTEADEEEGTQNVFEPEGMQLVEEILFSENPADGKNTLLRETKRLKAAALRLNHLAKAQEMADYQLWEAMQQQLIRVMAMGISGFDAPTSGDAITESAYALEGIQTLFRFYLDDIKSKNDKKHAENLLNTAIAYAAAHPDFDSFDRMEFIKNYLNPLYKILIKTPQSLKIKSINLPSAINNTAASIFETGAFNVNFYSYNYPVAGNNKQMAELGRLLFFDPILSGNGQRSCASCHRPEKAFTDGLDKSMAFGGKEKLARNAPTLLNSALQANYFLDSRVTYLEEQIVNVTNNPDELHGDFTEAALRLSKSNDYRQLFKKAFPGDSNGNLTVNGICRAIAAYERTLVSLNSRFDRHIRGEKELLTSDEIAGFNLFMGKAACGTCHFLPLFNGTVPPVFNKTEWEILGTPAKPDTANATIDPDEGRYYAKKMDLHRYAFKTATLRNIELTAPYMHNGVYKTLEQVVDFYNRGGGAGIGISLDNQTLPAEPLNLDKKEQQQLVAFMKSLTDTKGLKDAPAKLPQTGVDTLDSRTVGGIY